MIGNTTRNHLLTVHVTDDATIDHTVMVHTRRVCARIRLQYDGSLRDIYTMMYTMIVHSRAAHTTIITSP